MPLINTNLDANYCLDWGLWEGVREFLQNGKDQQEMDSDNKMLFEYDREKEIITIANKNANLSRSSIALGGSNKKDNNKTIGQHGEGYKVALMALTRLNKNVVIQNYSNKEKWTSLFLKDKKLDGAETLHIKIEKFRFTKTPDNNLTVKIHNVSIEEWEGLQEYFIFDLENANSFGCKNNYILFDEKYNGKVFVNGLFVESVKNEMAFGYSFKPEKLKLDRDRKRCDNFNLQWEMSFLASQWLKNNPEAVALSTKFIKEDYFDFKYVESSSLNNVSVQIANHLIEDIKKEYGEYSFPVSTQEEYEHVSKSHKGITPIVVTKREKEIISKLEEYGSPDNLKAKVGISNNSLKTPHDVLYDFFIKHKSSLNYEAENELKEILNLSESWKEDDGSNEMQDLQDEVFASYMEDNETDEEYNETQIIAEPKAEKEEIEWDDIPF